MIASENCLKESPENKKMEQNVEKSDDKSSADEPQAMETKEENEDSVLEDGETPLDHSIATSDINDSLFSPAWTSTPSVSSCSLHDESSVFNMAFLTPSTKARLSRLNPVREKLTGANRALIFGDNEEEMEKEEVHA